MMPAEEQVVEAGRYLVVPRTAVFLRREDSFLLLRGSAAKRRWPDVYNGIGGHIERGEDVLSAARRELLEETGLRADLWLCGTIIVDSGPSGIALYVLSGTVTGGQLRSSAEGRAEWIPIDRVPLIPTVRDVPAILSRLQPMRRGDPPFAARSFYDTEGNLQILFAD